MPSASYLRQNFPNPFNPATKIEYQVQRAGHVKLAIYNSLGQLVTVLVDNYHKSGDYSIQWNGTTSSGAEAASGIYFYQLQVDDFVAGKKMMLIK
jgi:flagellar hook assembly protein FlgD